MKTLTAPFHPIKTPLTESSLIEASAGTGKTYTIAGIVVRLILEADISLEQIVVVTFTNAAAQELKDRIRKKIVLTKHGFLTSASDDEFISSLLHNFQNKNEALWKLENALINFDKASIFTIHSFCQRILSENTFETVSVFNPELITEQETFIQAIADDFWRSNFYNSSPEFISYVLKKINGPEKFAQLLKVAANPAITIIPESDKPELTFLSDFRGLAQQVKNMWQQERGRVISLLESGNLNGNIYRQSKIISIKNQMDAFISRESEFPLFDGFEHFTASKIRKSLKKGNPPFSHPFFDICESLYKTAQKLQQQMDSLILYLKSAFLKHAQSELIKKKKASGQLFFDDLTYYVYDALNSPTSQNLIKNIRQKYKAALIDEFQDTDTIQHQILERIFSFKNSIFCMVGDPKQAIYSFRGADIFSYIQAAAHAGQKNTLTTNRRSYPGIIKAVNTLFTAISNPFIFQSIPFLPAIAAEQHEQNLSFPPLTLWYIDKNELGISDKTISVSLATQYTAEAVANEIVKLAGSENKIPLEHMAVLVRTNKQARIIRDKILSRGTACIIYSAQSVFHTQEAEELQAVISGISMYNMQKKLRAALVTEIIGESPELFDFADNDPSLLGPLIQEFKQYSDIWHKSGFLKMFHLFISKRNIKKRLLSFPNGQERLTNLLHLSELIHKADMQKKLTPAGIIKWFIENRLAEKIQHEDHRLRLSSSSGGVKIVTIHRSKGLEYPIVFCPFAFGGFSAYKENVLFHSESKAFIDLGSEDFQEHYKAARNEVLAENVRLLYVALTRAKQRAYIAWGKINKSEISALAYLFHGAGIEGEDIAEQLKQAILQKTDRQFFEDLKTLEDKSCGAIKIEPLPDYNPQIREYKSENSVQLLCRDFNALPDFSWRVSSYSSLIPGHSAKTEIFREDSDSFPKGAQPGIFFHEVLEHLDFTNSDAEYQNILIKKKLIKHGISESWLPQVRSIITKTISTPLSKNIPQLSLNKIPNTDRINELEFYFPVKITPHIFQNLPIDSDKLTLSQTKGFLKGYVDMIFYFKGKYYIVDWKSNYLGDTPHHYGQESLKKTMRSEYYTLQYYIYTLALHQYLALKIPDYKYQNHFGGVFYIFIRGVFPELGSDFGIYFDLPRLEDIN